MPTLHGDGEGVPCALAAEADALMFAFEFARLRVLRGWGCGAGVAPVAPDCFAVGPPCGNLWLEGERAGGVRWQSGVSVCALTMSGTPEQALEAGKD